MVRVILFCFFYFLGLQVPQIAENYTIGASAVVAELQNDYDKIATLAQKNNISVNEFLRQAQQTDNLFAKSIVELTTEKVPRYLDLKAQLADLTSGNIVTITKVVFFQHDPVIWQNVINTFKPGIYLNLDPAWYVFIALFSMLCIAIPSLIISFFKVLARALKLA